MSLKYSSIFIDIVGYCNASCFYCHSGVNAKEKKKIFMAPDDLDTILGKLKANSIISKTNVISLYNWGDPILHPDINKIAQVIGEHGFRFNISTNCSSVPKIDAYFAKNADTIMFSISGFSQETYKRMHGFSFEKIKLNMVEFTQKVREHNKRVKFVLLYHVYKYNVDEIEIAQQFCDEHGITFNPYFAILNHWWKLQQFITHELPEVETQKVHDELFGVENVEQILKKSPANYSCPQFGLLNIDVTGNVVTCCQVPVDYPYYSSGNILQTDTIYDSISKKNSHSGCAECLSSGLAYYINTSIDKPKYRKSSKQRYYAMKMLFHKALLRIMK